MSDYDEHLDEKETAWTDPSQRAKNVLDSILADSTPRQMSAPTARDDSGLQDVELEKRGQRVLQAEAARDTLRVLFVTRNTSVLTEGSAEQQRLADLCKVFSEVHVIVLSMRRDSTNTIIRVGDRMWVYPTYSKHWWHTAFDAKRIAAEQLVFADGFRPDLVVALDPFESGLAGMFIADKYTRSLQVHVLDDISDPAFKRLDKRNGWRLWIARFVLDRVVSIRVNLDSLIPYIERRYKHTKGRVQMLPFYFDLRQMRDAEPQFSLRERYPQFTFIVLTASPLTEDAHIKTVLDSVARLFASYPKFGLVIVGNGPRRSYLEERAEALGIGDQVIFEPWTDDLVSHLKTADLYMNVSADRSSERRILEVAAAGLPFVSVETETLATLFKGEEAGYLCAADDLQCFTKYVAHFLNHNDVRARHSDRARAIVFDRLEEDSDSYIVRYRDHIEMALSEDME